MKPNTKLNRCPSPNSEEEKTLSREERVIYPDSGADTTLGFPSTQTGLTLQTPTHAHSATTKKVAWSTESSSANTSNNIETDTPYPHSNISRRTLSKSISSYKMEGCFRAQAPHPHHTHTHTTAQPWCVGRIRFILRSWGGGPRHRRISPRRPAGATLLLLQGGPLDKVG